MNRSPVVPPSFALSGRRSPCASYIPFRALYIRCRAFVCAWLLVTSAATAQAQTSNVEPEVTDPNALYVELGGAGGLSVNYDRRFLPSLIGRVGVGIVPCFFACAGYTSVPVAAYGLIGGTSHHIEYGGGVTFLFPDHGRHHRFLVPSVGYRYQRPNGGFVFRANGLASIRLQQPIGPGNVYGGSSWKEAWGVGVSSGYAF